MVRRNVTLPEIGLIAGTRAALGAGAALLLADRLSDEQRRAVGWTLFAVGAISTFPLMAQVLFGDERSTANQTDQRPLGARRPDAEQERFAHQA